MDPAALYGSANAYFVNEEYEEALKHYICAVALQEDCAEYRIGRAAAYLKLGRFAEALDDADRALLGPKRSHVALHWKGVAQFYLGDFAGAKLSFEESLRINSTSQMPRARWLRKCDAELSGSTLPLGGIAASVSHTAASSQKTAAAAAPSPVVASSPAVPVEVPKASDLTISGRKPVRREWYQNNTSVVITIFAKGVDESKCKVEFSEKAMTLCFPLPGGDAGEEYQLDLDLCEAVQADACKLEVAKMKVEVVLAKKAIGLQWKDLERQEEVIVELAEQPAYPTSSKQKRDWDKVDKEIEAELSAEKPEGDGALNKLFREIYERADPDTRRAMNKSFQTSGGTVLSTNWGEVAQNDYEGKDRPTAPEGQEWRKG